MGRLDSYRGRPIREVILDDVDRGDGDVLVFLMGPYRLLDPSSLYPDRPDVPLPPDPLAPASGRDGVDPDEVEATLRGLCDRLAERTGVTPFLASEVDVPTKYEVERDGLSEPGMAVIDQSVAFAAASEGSAFAFTRAGSTTGVGAEAGAIPEFFDLRSADPARDPRTLHVFEEAEYDPETGTYEQRFASASIDEMDRAYRIPFSYFEDRRDLLDSLETYVEMTLLPLVR